MKKIYLDGPVPLVEGEPPHAIYMEPDGRTYTIQYEQSDYDSYDPFGGREKDTETYFLSEEDEWYGYITHCKHCETEFMAWSNDEEVRNYCPGCGKQLNPLIQNGVKKDGKQ